MARRCRAHGSGAGCCRRWFGFLFGRHILHQIGDDVALRPELAGVERHAASDLRPYADSVVHVVVAEVCGLDLLHGQVFDELVGDCNKDGNRV